jgi:hypothetical protein
MQCNCALYSMGTMDLFPKGKVAGRVINLRISADVPVLPLYPSCHTECQLYPYVFIVLIFIIIK